MKLIILHGGGLVSKLNKLSSIKQNFDPMEITELAGKSLNLGEIKLEISSSSLFNPKRLVIIEDSAALNLDGLPDDGNLTLVLNFNKSLTEASVILKEAKKRNAEIYQFSEEQETSIFPFLDMLSSSNSKALLELDKYLDEWGNQYVLTMMAYSLRRFVLPAKKLPPYVLKKIEDQKRNFPREKIRQLYRQIIETDFKIKQGQIEPKIGMFLLAEKFLD